MLGPKLMSLAALVGLTQGEVARHLGVHRSYPNHWARALQEVPEHYREGLTGLVFSAVEAWVKDTKGVSTQALRERFGPGFSRRRTLRQILAGVLEVTREQERVGGQGPGGSVLEILEELVKFRELSEAQLDRPDVVARLRALTRRLDVALSQRPHVKLVLVLGQEEESRGSHPKARSRGGGG